MANSRSHLGVFLSTMETQLDKTTETLSAIVTVNQIQTDFCFSQSGGSSSPVTILIPVSVLNKSSLKPSFSESLSSELGGYM